MINTSTFEYQDSIWQDIVVHLQADGFDVYSPGMKVGECVSPYIVVKNDGSTRHASFSTDVDFYAIMCYVPRTAYSTLEPEINERVGASFAFVWNAVSELLRRRVQGSYG